MPNRLEKFIESHRDEFDSEEMSAESWKKVESKINPGKRVDNKISKTWWAAAASILILISVVSYLTLTRSTKNDNGVVKKIPLPSKEIIDGVDTSYTNQMFLYAYIIEIKQQELNKRQKVNPDLYKEFLKDDNQLDSSYNFLKSELSRNPNKELLLEAMIQNLQLKINLLSTQLDIIQKTKNKKKDYENKNI